MQSVSSERQRGKPAFLTASGQVALETLIKPVAVWKGGLPPLGQ